MIEQCVTLSAVASLIAWIVLAVARGGFWRVDQRLTHKVIEREMWPAVTAVIPARNEVATIQQAVASLLHQDYRGPLRVVVIDDHSDDGTTAAARAAARDDPRLLVAKAAPLAAGWTGKLWALDQGIALIGQRWPDNQYLLLTDADIAHAPDKVRRLVAKALDDDRVMVSLMVKLRCEGFWEHLLVPAFVFFFQKLFPFPWVNAEEKETAAAAGGCILIDHAMLARAGGLKAIRNQLIDDCALAARIKPYGRIWLGLAESSRSLRPYPTFASFWSMVTRTAFTQLRFSSWRLALTVFGMLLLYVVPPVAVILGLVYGTYTTIAIGLAAWAAMGAVFTPTLSLYDQSGAWNMALPLAASLYTLMTIGSAWDYWRDRGGAWKGRTYLSSDPEQAS